MDVSLPQPRLVAWEITRACNLSCAHCRAAANYGPYPGELSTNECFSLIDGILEVSIGHALIADALRLGLSKTVKAYPAILGR